MKSALHIFLIAALMIAWSSCLHDINVENLPLVSFTNDVQPVIAGNCTQAGCHGSVDTEKFTLMSYDDIMVHVEKGNGRKSNLYRAITDRSDEFMPPAPSAPLSDDQIRLIFVWIEQGALNN